MLCYVFRRWDCCALSGRRGVHLGIVNLYFVYINSKRYDQRLWQLLPGWFERQTAELFVQDEEG